MLIDKLRAHTDSTGCTDSQLLEILCRWLDEPLWTRGCLDEFLMESIAESGLPQSAPWPHWTHLEMFSPDDREMVRGSLSDIIMDEVDVAAEINNRMDKLSIIEAITLVYPDDVQQLVEMLDSIRGDPDEHSSVSGAFLRVHAEDEDNIEELLSFACRMNLLNDDEDELTDLGRQFVEHHL